MSDEVVIHIVDDEEPVRKSLAFLMTVSGHAVRVHNSASSFLSVAKDLDHACLVTDLRMPEMNGVELLQQLQREDAMIPAIVITGHADVPMAVEAMKAGALDFIEKPFVDEVLLDAVAGAIAELGRKLRNAEDVLATRQRIDQLSERERQVMEGIVAGLPNKTIAYNLNISPRTVEAHRANVMARMNARNLPALVRMVLAAEADKS
ncbi:response regulator FixJ [Paracoccus saliphilus]|uniref:Response regulator n=1 Tax=Paracoccus saliphilus TaxID=405559 RepID=A0AA45W7Z8_9RHOB|nr:response regulator FixJ [Paracoccus saliphilus]WCR04543.1 response regulator [Paracoccus saliphilus]SIT13390.1 two component transcriptional regulator, LuxR family [Paracoccus saliphilus]